MSEYVCVLEDGTKIPAITVAAALLLDFNVTNQEAFHKMVGAIQKDQGDLAAADFIRQSRWKAICLRQSGISK